MVAFNSAGRDRHTEDSRTAHTAQVGRRRLQVSCIGYKPFDSGGHLRGFATLVVGGLIVEGCHHHEWSGGGKRVFFPGLPYQAADRVKRYRNIMRFSDAVDEAAFHADAVEAIAAFQASQVLHQQQPETRADSARQARADLSDIPPWEGPDQFAAKPDSSGQQGAMPEPTPRRKRGRPLGSKNRPKVAAMPAANGHLACNGHGDALSDPVNDLFLI